MNDLHTEVPHILAVGDIVGFPSWQARRWNKDVVRLMRRSATIQPWQHLPYGLYTIPEIAMIGATEQELTSSQCRMKSVKLRLAKLHVGRLTAT